MASFYEIEMQHSEESFKALAHMQYDMFCKSNRMWRTAFSLMLMMTGVVCFSEWWGILLVAYGGYLATSTYVSSNRTAHKLSEQLRKAGRPFPSSRYVFRDRGMDIYCLPEGNKDGSESYSDVRGIAEDGSYFYIFRDEYGGYMIPKAALGDSTDAFRDFLEERTQQTIRRISIPIVRFINWLWRRKK